MRRLKIQPHPLQEIADTMKQIRKLELQMPSLNQRPRYIEFDSIPKLHTERTETIVIPKREIRLSQPMITRKPRQPQSLSLNRTSPIRSREDSVFQYRPMRVRQRQKSTDEQFKDLMNKLDMTQLFSQTRRLLRGDHGKQVRFRD